LFLLTWVGAQEIMPATVLLGQVCTVILFFYLLVILPFLSWLETALVLA
jgi:quinol-cytochrome oxidoreductase complex cytochrome b subunit